MLKVVIKITKLVIWIEFLRQIPGKKLAFSYQHSGKNFTPITPMFKTQSFGLTEIKLSKMPLGLESNLFLGVVLNMKSTWNMVFRVIIRVFFQNSLIPCTLFNIISSTFKNHICISVESFNMYHRQTTPNLEYLNKPRSNNKLLEEVEQCEKERTNN